MSGPDGGRGGDPRRVLLLGARRAALAAVKRLGLDALVLHEHEEWPDLGRPVSFDDPEEVVRAAREVIGKREVHAVLGLTERSVVAAAHVRAELSLPGIDVACALRCTDKLAMKEAIRARDVRCTDFVAVNGSAHAPELAKRLGLPVVLKRKRSSGSRGQVVARSVTELGDRLENGMLAERYVIGREMSVESFVQDGRVIFANTTEYLVPLHANIVPAALEPDMRAAVHALNAAAIAAVGVERGMTHCELFLTPDGPVFGEIAARPPGGRIMPLLRRAYGFDPWRVLFSIELGERVDVRWKSRRSAGVFMLHPGEGRVADVRGLESASSLPGVHKLVLRVAPGDRVTRRDGSGQDVGYVECVGATRDEVAAALLRAVEELRVVME
jgi:biotin carboxylase